jgi:hypothetical protein
MPSNPGESGAPVFTASGQVVAIKMGGYDKSQNLNLLVPLNLAQNLLNLVPDRNQGPYVALRRIIADAWRDRFVRFSRPENEAYDVLTLNESSNCTLTYSDRSYSRFNDKVIDQLWENKALLGKLRPEYIGISEGSGVLEGRWMVTIEDSRHARALGVGRRNLVGPFLTASMQFGNDYLGSMIFPKKEQAERVSILLREIIKSCN